jgi:branched-chain amino acid transport system permease protein
MDMGFEKIGEERSAINYFVIISLLLLVILGIALPKGARSLVIHMMTFFILAMGYDISLGFTKQCSLGHSVFFGVGAYGAIFSILHLKMSILPSIFFSFVSGFIFAMIVG